MLSRQLVRSISSVVVLALGATPVALAAPMPLTLTADAGPQEKTVVRRFALITGASQGGGDRVALRYASSDAQALRHVLSDLGGLADAETVMLLDVDRAGLRRGFDRMKQMIAAVRAPDSRTEVIFYYSGHSDETGLLLGPDRVTYTELKAWVEETGADVRIAVLDSCASGALTRTKGGVHRPPFLVDTSSAAHGHAYLTASSENEAAQESDRIGAAYFTHYLVSGLRGAADVSHDGRVTLSEAYQYAFTETLARTEATRGGPQHASYDFQLAGKGDLVMTDLRATSASLILPAEMSGRLFIRDAQGQLIAEVHKLPAQPILLGLPPGRYRVTLDEPRRLSETTLTLGAGEQQTLDARKLVAVATSPTVRRGAGGDAIDPAATLWLDASAHGRQRAVNLSVYPGLDTNGGVGSENAFVFGFAASSARLHGLALTLGHEVTGDVNGTQIAGFGNLTYGNLHGLQLGGAANGTLGALHGMQISGALGWTGALDGLQLSGALSVASTGGTGAQVTGAVNASGGDFKGLQLAGAVNADGGNFRGLQLAGAANATRGDFRGIQVAGGANVAGQMTGLQLAVVNVADEVNGAQIGIINIARKVRGTQIGLVDIAGTQQGASIGLLTFVRDGIREVEASSNEVGATMVSLLLGTRHVYTRLGVGHLGSPSDFPSALDGDRALAAGSGAGHPHLLFQWGMGGHFQLADRWFLESEVVGTQFYRTDHWHQEDAVLGSLRLLGGFRVTSLVSVVFGATYNVLTGWSDTDLVTGTGAAESVIHDGHTTIRMYPGLAAGLRI